MIYLCATPIGNLEDITLRVIRILKEVDIVAAEDSRQAAKLMNHLGITKRIVSYHHHNRKIAVQNLINLAIEGKSIAVMSDAGMPGISDPGIEIVQSARENGIQVTVLPGANSALTALVLSGMEISRFVFEGFLPRDNKMRAKVLKAIRYETRTVVFYEAPHRIKETLNDLLKFVGNRNIAIAREMTKIYEEVLCLSIEKALTHFEETVPRGEFVIVLQGAEDVVQDDFSEISLENHIDYYFGLGMDLKEAIKQVAQDRGLPKSEVYKATIRG